MLFSNFGVKQCFYNFQNQLMEAKDCLKAAARLTEELDRKSERIEQLNQEGTYLFNIITSTI